MIEEIQQVTKLIMYGGPSASELIKAAIQNNEEFFIQCVGDITILTIESIKAYDLKVTDIYSYNLEGQLIKQVLVMNGKQKTVFDKYKEATIILSKINKRNKMVS